MKGKAWTFGDNISTDLIAPGRLFHLRSNLPELAKHVLEDADPEFPSKVKAGDSVRVGSQLFEDKRNPDVRFLSPVGGKVSDILGHAFKKRLSHGAVGKVAGGTLEGEKGVQRLAG